LRATFFFFGVGGVSADSCAIALDAAESDATSDGCSEVSFGAGPAGTGPAVVIGGSAVTRDGAADGGVSVGFGAAVAIIGGGTRDSGSGRALSVGFGPAAVTVIGGGGVRDGGSERASVDFDAGAATVADAGGFDVTRDGRSGRAGVTNDVAEDCTALASEGSYWATAWFLTVGSTSQWKATAKTA
jgi:hypothetical protein